MKPSVGRVVHYVSRGSADGKFPATCRKADITEVHDHDVVGLCVVNPTGLFFHPLSDGGVAYDADRLAGTRHWPERAE